MLGNTATEPNSRQVYIRLRAPFQLQGHARACGCAIPGNGEDLLLRGKVRLSAG